jgi:hypothetical protein
MICSISALVNFEQIQITKRAILDIGLLPLLVSAKTHNLTRFHGGKQAFSELRYSEQEDKAVDSDAAAAHVENLID